MDIIIDISSSDGEEPDYVPQRIKRPAKKGKGKARARTPTVDLSDDDVLEIWENENEPEWRGTQGRPSTSSAPVDNGDNNNNDKADQDPLVQVLEIVPDVEPAYAQQLIERNLPTYGAKVVETVLHTLLEDRSYPKVTKKRKATGPGSTSSKKAKVANAAVDLGRTDRPFEGGPHYTELAVEQLSLDFPAFRKPDLRRLLLDHGGFYAPTVLYIRDQQKRGQNMGCVPKRVTTARPVKGKGRAREDAGLEREKAWLANRGPTPEPTEQPKGEGEDIECGCCFTEYPFSQMVQCPDAHLFCSDCVKQYAETLLGAHDVRIVCMDQSGCKLAFPDSELQRLLSTKLWELYERVKQRKDIEAAGLENLEECPFCEYKVVIDNPAEKLFRCGNDETCGAVTCRQCKKADHLPKSCKEMEDDKHLEGRHTIEEAMTAALMRNCPKCQKAFVKESGCNKMSCPNCGTLSCYVCRKVISGYEHFNNAQPGQAHASTSKKCLLWDTATSLEARHADDVKAAAERALAEYRAENPDIDETDIRVDLPVAPPPPPVPAAALAYQYHGGVAPLPHVAAWAQHAALYALPPVIPPPMGMGRAVALANPRRQRARRR